MNTREISKSINKLLSDIYGGISVTGIATASAEDEVYRRLLNDFDPEFVLDGILTELIHEKTKAFIKSKSIGQSLSGQQDIFDDSVLDALFEAEGVTLRFGDCGFAAVDAHEQRVVQNHARVSAAFSKQVTLTSACKNALRNDPNLRVVDVWEQLKER